MLATQCHFCGKIWTPPRSIVNSYFCEVQSNPGDGELFRTLLDIIERPMLRHAQRQELLQGPTWDSPEDILFMSIARILNLAKNKRYDCSKSLFGLWKKTIDRLTRDSADKSQFRRTTPGSQLPDGGVDQPPFDVTDDDKTHRYCDPHQSAETKESIDGLYREVDHLPGEHQAVILAWLNLPKPKLRTISRDLNMPYSRVRQLFSEAKSILAKQLG